MPPAPPLGALAAAVLPVADFFMLAMFSKPPSGTLRTTWVTPSTYWMTLATFVGAMVIARVAHLRRHREHHHACRSSAW